MLLYSSLSFIVSYLLVILFMKKGIDWGFSDHPGERKLQKKPISRMGGMAFFAVSMLGVWLWSLPLSPWFLLAGSIIYLGGLIDDLKKENKVIHKLIFQIIGAGLFAYGLELPQSIVLSSIILKLVVFIVLVALINAFNLMDNMNGLVAGMSLAILFFLSYMSANQSTELTLFILILASALLPFYLLNYPWGKIFMGDQGSQVLGFYLPAIGLMIGFKKIELLNGVNFFALLALLFIVFLPFIADTLWVIYIRRKEGRAIFQGDLAHLSHGLVRKGFSPTMAAAILILTQMLCLVGAWFIVPFVH